jgi:hypothetical protein
MSESGHFEAFWDPFWRLQVKLRARLASERVPENACIFEVIWRLHRT